MGNENDKSTSKLEVIIGREGVQRLSNATVMVLGTGGVGSSCVEALARGGVGNLVLLDRDVVEQSNINRQAIAFRSTVGRRKVDVMRAMVADINPRAHVEVHDDFLRAHDVAPFLEPWRIVGQGGGAGGHGNGLQDTAGWRLDWVVDALDTVSTKLEIARYACQTGLPLVSSMGGGNKLHPECFRFADLYETVNCPLCRIMRKEGRKRGVTHLNVLYSSEVPVATSKARDASWHDRADLGTMSYIPPIMGQMLAGWVIRRLLGIDDGVYEPPAMGSFTLPPEARP